MPFERERNIIRIPRKQPSRFQSFISQLQIYLPWLCGSIEIAEEVIATATLPPPEAAKVIVVGEVVTAALESAIEIGLDRIADAGKAQPSDHPIITADADIAEEDLHDVIGTAKIAAQIASSVALGTSVTGMKAQIAANMAIDTAAITLNNIGDVLIAEGEQLAVNFADRLVKHSTKFESAREI